MTSESPARERSWLHWGLIVAGLYVTWFIALTLPVLILCFLPLDFPSGTSGGIPGFFKQGLVDVYKEGPYWILVGVLALSQFLFLRVPIRIATRRPVSRKSIWLPVIMSGFWFACLVAGGSAAFVELFRNMDKFNPLACIVTAVVSWIVWSIVFYRISHMMGAEKSIKLQSRGLLGGSILELLIAVPAHIVARGRGDCCAGIFTLFGITMGLSVMLLSFGPAVFLLYHARWRHLKLASATPPRS